MLNAKTAPNAHRGRRSRGYLPHFNRPGLVQALTFRLADALPRHVAEPLADADTPDDGELDLSTDIEGDLDDGYGACYLRRPHIARLVEDALHHFDGDRYRLLAWVVMPNHVHAIVEIKESVPLGTVVGAWQSYTAKQANLMLGRSGDFWCPDYFDRVIRSERHYLNAVTHVHRNPVKAGLVDRATAWRFSSARLWA